VSPDSPREPHSLAVLAHELRTPLNAVLGYADAMRGEVFGPLPAPYREQAGLIHGAASHLLALVEVMAATAEAGARPLAMERLGAPDVEQLLAHAISVVATRASAANLELRAALVDRAAIRLRADRVALVQILINLIDNAVKFAAPGGAIDVRAAAAAGEVQLTVQNQGGAGPSSGEAGSGLGLRLVRGLSEAMGGSFDMDLRPGGGARAVVRLPAIAEA
jgi:signal transduction histidine kinase